MLGFFAFDAGKLTASGTLATILFLGSGIQDCLAVHSGAEKQVGVLGYVVSCLELFVLFKAVCTDDLLYFLFVRFDLASKLRTGKLSRLTCLLDKSLEVPLEALRAKGVVA